MKKNARKYRVANTSVDIVSSDAPFLEEEACFHEMDTAGDACDLEVRLETAHEVGDSKSIEVVQLADGNFELRMEGACCRVEAGCKEALLRIVPDRSVLEYILRFLFSILLLRGKGGFFHAAGLVMDGRGYLFSGPSGAGKSTIAAASDKHKVFNDDTSVVDRTDNGEYFLYPTPAWVMGIQEEAGHTESAVPVSALFFLHHDDRTYVNETEEPVTDNLRRLLENLRYVPPMKQALEEALDFLTDFRKKVLIADLHFKLEDRSILWDVVNRYIEEKI